MIPSPDSRPLVPVRLEPAGHCLQVAEGSPLRDALFTAGVEFPCGGHGRCRGCRVRVTSGHAEPSPEDRALLRPEELALGWRLACRLTASLHLTLEIAQWEALILDDDSCYQGSPRDGLGIAIDVGTTTLVAQLVDRLSGHVLAVRSALNAQARHGADVMSRVEFATRPDEAGTLTDLLRQQIGDLVRDLVADQGHPAAVQEILLVGNTVMHHLFSGLPVNSLAHHPFTPANPETQTFTLAELGWDDHLAAPGTAVSFLPCLGGFVGSDILAGVVATRLAHSPQTSALVDLGTNGEIVVGNAQRLLCASTAAGPAFEGARITMGMRAATGAIAGVSLRNGTFACQILGGGKARGICGSGLVDAIAVALDLGAIAPNGRLTLGSPLPLTDTVSLFQRDVRELQLAKGAITAGLHLLARQTDCLPDQWQSVHLAGAFGNYINRASARRIGLLPFPIDRVRPAGNTAILGARMILMRPPDTDLSFRDLRSRTEHVVLNDDPGFLDTYVGEMAFPAI